MASQQVIESLEVLHRNLEKMKPAIEQIKITGRLVEEVNKLPGIHATFIADIQKVEKDFHALLKKQMEEEGKSLSGKVEEVTASAKEAMSGLAEHNDQILKLRNNIQSYYSKIDGMQIPYKLDAFKKSSDERLSKIDSSSVTIAATLHNIQARFESLEKNIKELINEGTEKQIRQMQTNQDKFMAKMDAFVTNARKQAGVQKTYTIVICILVVICTGLILFLKK